MSTILLSLLLARPASAYDTVKFLDPVKLEPGGRPTATAASGNSKVYTLDEKKGVIFIHDGLGKPIKTLGRPGSGDGELDRPQGITIFADKIYVADTNNNRIQIFDEATGFVARFGERGSEPGQFKSPRSVAVGQDGRIYVADTGNDRVQVFTSDGILLTHFDGSIREKGRLKKPTKIAVDSLDNVYVLDSGNNRIQKFNASARPAKEFSLPGDDFALDNYGFLYILDSDSGRVMEQSPEGSILGRFGSRGSGKGQFKKPSAIAIGPEGNVYVLDEGQNTIQPVEISNKLKTSLLGQNGAAKILVSGPAAIWPVPASILSQAGDSIYAYLPEQGQFAVLDESGREKSRFGASQGKGPSVTKHSDGFAASAKLGLYVSDTPNNRVQHFSLDGTWKENLAEKAGFFDSAKKEGRVRDPRGIAINEQGTIYVADTGNRRIDAFSPDGTFLFAIGPNLGGELNLEEPTAVAWDKARFVYFTDRKLKKIFKTEPSGALLASWGEEGDGPGQFKAPAALALDNKGYVYVLDSDLKRVSVFSQDGRWVTDFLSGGNGEKNLANPGAIMVQGQRLLISDPGLGRIVSFDLHPILSAPNGISTASQEGVVALEWSPVKDLWTLGYRVLRSKDPAGPFEEIGATRETRFEDNKVKAYQTYYYQIATEAKTKDLGVASVPAQVMVAGAFNKPPLEISTVTIGNIFPANYKWYLKNPAGTAALTNNVNLAFENVKLTFRLKDYMDFGFDTEIPRLEPQQSVELPLIATLNNKILGITEETPIQAEFTMTYFESGKKQTISRTLPLRVYSRNAITWENPERIANFITPNDTPIFDFGRQVMHDAPRSDKAEALNPNVVTAMHFWDALSETGVKFLENPANPYGSISADLNFPVDFTQFPRETLKRKSGQCDDLTTLMISLLDSANVKAAIVDYPGHMALIFDTEAESLAEANLPEDMLILRDGTYWVPLETTLMGKPFPEAVRRAAYSFKTESGKGNLKVIDVRKAWETFEPATMPPSEWTSEPPNAAAVAKRFSAEASALFDDAYKFLKNHLQDRLTRDPQDQEAALSLGRLLFEGGHKEDAARQFAQILAGDPQNSSALNNLGNISFLSGDFDRAEKFYLEAATAEDDDTDIWMNLLKTEVHLKNPAKAAEYAKKIIALDAAAAPAAEALVKSL